MSFVANGPLVFLYLDHNAFQGGAHRRRKRGAGGARPPNNLRGGATYPLAPPIIHPPVLAKLFLSILSLNVV